MYPQLPYQPLPARSHGTLMGARYLPSCYTVLSARHSRGYVEAQFQLYITSAYDNPSKHHHSYHSEWSPGGLHSVQPHDKTPAPSAGLRRGLHSWPHHTAIVPCARASITPHPMSSPLSFEVLPAPVYYGSCPTSGSVCQPGRLSFSHPAYSSGLSYNFVSPSV